MEAMQPERQKNIQNLVDISKAVGAKPGDLVTEKTKNVFLKIYNGTLTVAEKPKSIVGKLADFFSKEDKKFFQELEAFVQSIDPEELAKDPEALRGLTALKSLCKSKLLEQKVFMSQGSIKNFKATIASLEDKESKAKEIQSKLDSLKPESSKQEKSALPYSLDNADDKDDFIKWIEEKAIACQSEEDFKMVSKIIGSISTSSHELQEAHNLALLSHLYVSQPDSFLSLIGTTPEIKNALPKWLAHKDITGTKMQFLQDMVQAESPESRLAFLDRAYKELPANDTASVCSYFLHTAEDNALFIGWIEKKAASCRSNEDFEIISKMIGNISISSSEVQEARNLAFLSHLHFSDSTRFLSLMDNIGQTPEFKDTLPKWLAHVEMNALEKSGTATKIIEIVLNTIETSQEAKEKFPPYIRNAVDFLNDEHVNLLLGNGQPITLSELHKKNPKFIQDIFKEQQQSQRRPQINRLLNATMLVFNTLYKEDIPEQDISRIGDIFKKIDTLSEKEHIPLNTQFVHFQKKVLEKKILSPDCNHQELAKDMMRLINTVRPEERKLVIDSLHALIPILDKESITSFHDGILEYASTHKMSSDLSLFMPYIDAISTSILEGEKELFLDIGTYKEEIQKELDKENPDYTKVGQLFSQMTELDTKQIAKNNLEAFLYGGIGGFSGAFLSKRGQFLSSSALASIANEQKNPFYQRIAVEMQQRRLLVEDTTTTTSLVTVTHDLFTNEIKYKSEFKEYKKAQATGDFPPTEQYKKDAIRSTKAIGSHLFTESFASEKALMDAIDKDIDTELMKGGVANENIPKVRYQIRQLLSQSTLNMVDIILTASGRTITPCESSVEAFRLTYQCTITDGKVKIQAAIPKLNFNEETGKPDHFAMGVQLTFDLEKMDDTDFLYTEGCCTDCTITRFSPVREENIKDLQKAVRDKGFSFPEPSQKK